LDADAINDNGGTATMSFDFNFLTNEGDWNGANWISSEGNNKEAADDTLFMLLVRYDDSGTYVSQELVEITSVYDAQSDWGYILLGNNSYPYQTGEQTYQKTFDTTEADNYQLYFVILDASSNNPDHSSSLVIDNLVVDGGLETVVDVQQISGNVVTDTDIITGDVDAGGADGVDRITTITVGGDIFTSNEDGTAWSLSTDDAGTSATFGSFSAGLLVIATDVGGTLAIQVSGAGMGDYTYTAPTNAGNIMDSISYTLIDNDGTPSTADLNVNIWDQSEFDHVVEGSSVSETLDAGLGNQILYGGGGDDIFVWLDGDQDGGTDFVADFMDNGDVDVLDLSDLLQSNGDFVLQAADNGGNLQLNVVDTANSNEVVQTVDTNVAAELDVSVQLANLIGSGNIDDGTV
jgi:hypothetical protein